MRNLFWGIVLCSSVLTILSSSISDASEETSLSLSPENNLISIYDQGWIKILLKSHHTNAFHNLKISGECSLFQIKITPRVINQLNPNDEMVIYIKLTLLNDAAQSGLLTMTVQADEFAPKVLLEMDVVAGSYPNERVLQVKGAITEPSTTTVWDSEKWYVWTGDWRSYLNGLFILLLTGFFIWRKIKFAIRAS